MSDGIRVAVVDDHPIFRAGIHHTVARDTSMEIVAEGASADDATRIARDYAPDVVLLDINMPGDGLVAAKVIRRQCPRVKIVMLTVSENEDHLVAALECGASAYILKGIVASELLRTIRDAHLGQSYVSPGFGAQALLHMLQGRRDITKASRKLALLNEQEREVSRLVSQGLSNKQIARSLDVSEHVVKRRLSKIMHSLRVTSRTAAAAVLSAQKADPTASG